jgi:hypothetical protein
MSDNSQNTDMLGQMAQEEQWEKACEAVAEDIDALNVILAGPGEDVPSIDEVKEQQCGVKQKQTSRSAGV